MGLGRSRTKRLGPPHWRGFQKVAEDGFVGPEADAHVLEVDDDGVDIFEVFRFWGGRSAGLAP